MKTITVTVMPGGKTKIETSGFSGSACQQATEKLISELSGGNAVQTKLKPEFYNVQQDANQHLHTGN